VVEEAGQKGVDLPSVGLDQPDDLLDRRRGAVQGGLILPAQVDLHHLDQTAGAQPGGDPAEHPGDAVLAVKVDAAGEDLLGVEQDGVDHLGHRRARSVVGAARLEQADDLGPAIAGALHDLLQSLGSEELSDRPPGDRGQLGQRDHGVAVAAQHVGLDVAHRRPQLLGDEGPEASGVEHARHADHPPPGEAAHGEGHLGHGVEGIADDDEDGLRGRRRRLPDHPAHDTGVGHHQVVARHPGLAGDPARDHHDVAARSLLVAVGAGDLAVVPDHGARFEDVQRLALGQALDDVDQDDVGVVTLGETLGQGGADVARADDGDLVAHGGASGGFGRHPDCRKAVSRCRHRGRPRRCDPCGHGEGQAAPPRCPRPGGDRR
jgi:hypothetical protein